MESNYSIAVHQISKKFKDISVLHKIDLVIEKGEIFGLLGPSGAGKTTLIKIITGQIRQSSGKAYLLGMDTLNLPRSAYTKIGMVLDNSGVYERLSAYDNLKLFAELFDIPNSRIQEVLKKTGLYEARRRPVNKFSKGMIQRLVLARSIMHEPEILFLDEPTSGLDPATAKSIHEMILEQKAKGTAIFLTTHNMEEANKLCDTVALLDKGEIIERGHPKEICRKYNEQNRISILLKTGETVILHNDVMASDEIGNYFKKDLVESIHSSEPNLETVFLALTGRRFS